MDKDFPRNRWWFRGLFVTLRLRLEGRMHLGNENIFCISLGFHYL